MRNLGHGTATCKGDWIVYVSVLLKLIHGKLYDFAVRTHIRQSGQQCTVLVSRVFSMICNNFRWLGKIAINNRFKITFKFQEIT